MGKLILLTHCINSKQIYVYKGKKTPPFSFLLFPSNIGFVIPTEYLLSPGTGCSPQTTQELTLSWVVQTQLSIELFSAGAAQRQFRGAVTSRIPGACFPHRGAMFPALPHGMRVEGHGDSSSLILTSFVRSHQTGHLWAVCPIGPAGTRLSVFPSVSLLIQCTNVRHLHSISPLQN